MDKNIVKIRSDEWQPTAGLVHQPLEGFRDFREPKGILRNWKSPIPGPVLKAVLSAGPLRGGTLTGVPEVRMKCSAAVVQLGEVWNSSLYSLRRSDMESVEH